MKNFSPLPFLLFCLMFVVSCGTPQGTTETTVTMGTFNIKWLGDGRSDLVERSDADYLAIADLIIKSKADVLGLQEIENQDALDKVLRYLEDYRGEVLNAGNKQKLAVVYHKAVEVKSLGAYAPLQLDKPNRLRPGFVVGCKKGSFDWVQMIVHLKSTSRYDSTSSLRELSREYRAKQVEALQYWADSVQTAGEPDVVITGDLNDYPQRTRNATLTAMLDAGTMNFVTADLPSCRNKKWHLIDHVVVSESIMSRFVSGSARTENFYEFLTEAEADRISDHCPVVAKFSIVN